MKVNNDGPEDIINDGQLIVHRGRWIIRDEVVANNDVILHMFTMRFYLMWIHSTFLYFAHQKCDPRVLFVSLSIHSNQWQITILTGLADILDKSDESRNSTTSGDDNIRVNVSFWCEVSFVLIMMVSLFLSVDKYKLSRSLSSRSLLKQDIVKASGKDRIGTFGESMAAGKLAWPAVVVAQQYQFSGYSLVKLSLAITIIAYTIEYPRGDYPKYIDTIIHVSWNQ